MDLESGRQRPLAVAILREDGATSGPVSATRRHHDARRHEARAGRRRGRRCRRPRSPSPSHTTRSRPEPVLARRASIWSRAAAGGCSRFAFSRHDAVVRIVPAPSPSMPSLPRARSPARCTGTSGGRRRCARRGPRRRSQGGYFPPQESKPKSRAIGRARIVLDEDRTRVAQPDVVGREAGGSARPASGSESPAVGETSSAHVRLGLGFVAHHRARPSRDSCSAADASPRYSLRAVFEVSRARCPGCGARRARWRGGAPIRRASASEASPCGAAAQSRTRLADLVHTRRSAGRAGTASCGAPRSIALEIAVDDAASPPRPRTPVRARGRRDRRGRSWPQKRMSSLGARRGSPPRRTSPLAIACPRWTVSQASCCATSTSPRPRRTASRSRSGRRGSARRRGR